MLAWQPAALAFYHSRLPRSISLARSKIAASRNKSWHIHAKSSRCEFAGFLAGQIVKGSGMRVLLDFLVGIVGSIIGGWIFGLLGLASYSLLGQLVMATVGAIVLPLIVKAIKRT